MRVDLRALQRFADAALCIAVEMKRRRGSVLHQLPGIDVIIISDARMAALHKRFMNIAGPTDVITFQHGEIFVSAETAKANARRFRSTSDTEIRLYIVHGILHLMGFDDTTPAAARAMMKTQARLVAKADAALQRGSSG